MSLAPWMLATRFVLELCAVAGFGYAGWRLTPGGWRWAVLVVLPVLVIWAWGTFAVPHDPSRSGEAPVAVPGAIRLALEAAVLFGSAAALYAAGAQRTAIAFGVVLVLYQALAYDRVGWLLRH